MDFFASLEQAPIDPIFGLQAIYGSDTRENKVNASIGTYRTSEGTPYLLPSVVATEKACLAKQTTKEYLPIAGDAAYLEATAHLIFGSNMPPELAKIQTLGGTGALRIAAEILHQVGMDRVGFAVPTWVNHGPIFQSVGLSVMSCASQGLLDLVGTLRKKDVLLIQASCHNPTGIDPTPEMWHDILRHARDAGFFVVFDLAYQGFGDGLAEDVLPIRMFAAAGLSFAVAVSHSKNFGLYRDRVGALYIVCANRRSRDVVESQVKVVARTQYSNPPGLGAQVVTHILTDPSLRTQWEGEVAAMRRRLQTLRHQLVEGLTGVWAKEKVRLLAHQKGMFAYPALSPDTVQIIRDQYGIYLTLDSRINLGGLNAHHIERLVEILRTV